MDSSSKKNPAVKKPKNKMITMRVTQAQWDYLAHMADRIKAKSGFKITRASIILKLMEYGYGKLEQEFPKSKPSLLEDYDDIAS